jgi:hypothetical protein
MPNDDTDSKTPWFSPKTIKLASRLLRLLPVLMLITSIVYWVDARYMHKQAFSIYNDISDFRYNDLQIRVLEARLKIYTATLNSGGELSPDERVQYDTDLEQLKDLMKERNKALGLLGNTQ